MAGHETSASQGDMCKGYVGPGVVHRFVSQACSVRMCQFLSYTNQAPAMCCRWSIATTDRCINSQQVCLMSKRLEPLGHSVQ